ncbi:unnamed protein product [Penicillium discolor]
MHFSIIALIITTASLVTADSSSGAKCGTCNPVSGENCDLHHQFRLPMPNYEFLVFVPEGTACNIPCDDVYAAPSDLCKEVKLQHQCEA